MHNSKILLTLGILFSLALSLASVSAYSHSFIKLSDSLTFNEDIKGEDRGFSLKKSTDVPRKTIYGYYDWSFNPDIVYPHPSAYRISDGLALEAFRTFQQDSQAQNTIELERERRRFFFFAYPYSYGHGYYPRSYGYYGSYYPRYHGSYYSYGL